MFANRQLVTLALSLAPMVAAAQQRSIRGIVVDSAYRAVPFVNVTAGGSTRAIANDSGRFRIDVPSSGSVRLDLRRLGYMPTQFQFDRAPDTTVVLMLLVSPSTIAEMTIIATGSLGVLQKRGFYRRLAQADAGMLRGLFITPEDIDRRKPAKTSTLIDGISGIKLTTVRTANGRNVTVPTGPNKCMMTIYVDGQRIWPSTAMSSPMYDPRTRRTVSGPPMTEDMTLDVLVPISNIAAVEIYPRRSGAPLEYDAQTQDGCGVIVAWTK
jgi:hypothetical protein